MTSNISIVLFVTVTIIFAIPSLIAMTVYVRNQQRNPDSYNKLVQALGTSEIRIDSTNARMDKLEREYSAAQDKIHELQEQAIDLQAEISQLRLAFAEQAQIIKRLLTQMEKAGLTPDLPADLPALPAPSPAKVKRKTRAETSQLREMLKQQFSMSELDELAFSLEIDADELSGTTRATRVNSLISYAERRNMLDKLTELVAKERPQS